MSQIRLVVSDVDGTLVDKQKQLSPATIDAVARLRAGGTGFTIISARPRSGMMPIADRLGLDGPMGAFNGGIVFTRDGTVLAHHVIYAEAARGVVALAEGTAVDLWVFADDRWYASSAVGEHVDHERVASNQEPIVTSDMGSLLDRADKITFVSDDPDALSAIKARATRYDGQATIVQSQTYYLDVTAREANKGDGLIALAAAAGVPLTAIVALGDQFNDVPMLDRAGLAIAMGNAPDGVKAHADAVTAGNDADGVAQAIDTIILPKTGANA